jgi:uncharacterized repeat protein (TIGR03803 family)
MQSTKSLVVAFAALAVACGFLTPATSAQVHSKLEVLHAFHGKDGQSPSASVIFDTAGNLYGTTTSGGDDISCNVNGCGTVFQLTPATDGKWIETVLHSFNNEDGSVPTAGVIFDAAGNLYGTTSGLGYGWGNVFQLSPDGDGKWSETVLHAFSAGGSEYPFGGVIFDIAGDLYGTTYLGGDYNDCSDGGCGTVFKVARGAGGKWSYRTIHDFNLRDGYSPNAGLIRDAAGNLYGAAGGGPGKGGIYGGVVFKLARGANGRWSETVLYTFGQGDMSKGYDPVAVTFDRVGNLYGTAFDGGNYNTNCNTGCGGVFELISGANGKWTKKVVYIFHGSDGATPDAALTLDADGNLYGTTVSGGANNKGTVFKLTPHADGKWTETVLHSFNGNDGAEPEAGLIFDTGSLYGTTFLGGNFGECPNFEGCGVVFKLTP